MCAFGRMEKWTLEKKKGGRRGMKEGEKEGKREERGKGYRKEGEIKYRYLRGVCYREQDFQLSEISKICGYGRGTSAVRIWWGSHQIDLN